MTDKLVGIPNEIVLSKIYKVRDQKVMLDSDLAELYGVETRILNQAIKRNINRFPDAFMFQISEEEWEALISQFVISNEGRGGRRKLPYVFTEHGILMLSSVLNSTQAIKMSIRIIEMFVRLRETLLLYKDISFLYEQNDKRFMKQDQKIELLFTYLDKFIDKNEKPREKIGFKVKDDKNKV